MRVEQAVYGEVPGRGHGLRTSSQNAPIAVAIASKLDLPDAVPPGVHAWSPFVSGFPIDGHYVLARTFLDSSASRGGMVVTHALIVSLDDMCEVPSLGALFGLLAASSGDCPVEVATLEIDIACSTHAPAADLIGAANALTSQAPTPVVRLGVDGFEDLVDSLWRNFWPTLRRNFAFRISFGPNDAMVQPQPVLVCTPEQLQARWAKHLIVKPDDQKPESESARILCAQRELQPILSLAADLGLEVHTLSDLSRFERLHALLSGGESFVDFLTAVRLADGLSNQPACGVYIKEKLISRLTGLIPRVSCEQLLLMKNLTLAGFANTGPMWSAVENAVSNIGFLPVEDNSSVEMIAASIDENLAVPPWRSAVKAGLSNAALRDEPVLSKAIWRWAERSQATFAAVVGMLPADIVVEQRLAAEAPKKLRTTTPATLLSSLLKKHWLVAYGAVLASTSSPIEATGQQLKVDRDQFHNAGLRSALRYASPLQILECALAHKDLRLIGLCAEEAAENPKILSKIRCEDVTEQRIWSAAIRKNPSLWRAPDNAAGVRDNVLAQLCEHRPVDAGLIESLAQTPLADLSAALRREQLWSILPDSQRDQYLRSTAIGWLEAIANGAVATIPEPPLERAIVASSKLQSVLETSAMTIEARLAIISVLPSFGEQAFISLLSNLLNGVRNLSHSDSEQLGALVASRRWERAAKYLSERFADYRQDLMPGLRLCANLLSLYTRWRLDISKPSAAEKWSAFEEEARHLYPDGPDTDELWSRAGGKNSDLPGRSQSGATRWHIALNSIRKGGHPTGRRLLKRMCQDFPSNEKLRLYASDSDIVGWR